MDEHKWAHTRTAGADGFVTVITDLTDVVAGHGPARLLDMVPGRSAAAMTDWLAARDQAFRDRVEIVAMDGFGGYKNAATTALPDAVTVMDPFHVVALPGHKQAVDPDRRGVRRRRPRRGRGDLVCLPAAHRGKTLLAAVIDLLRRGLPAGLDELAQLGRTLHRRRADVLAYFTHRASNAPTEAINGRLEALRRNALGFRNLVNYRIRSLLHCGSLAL